MMTPRAWSMTAREARAAQARAACLPVVLPSGQAHYHLRMHAERARARFLTRKSSLPGPPPITRWVLVFYEAFASSGPGAPDLLALVSFKIIGGLYSALAAASFFLSVFASAGVQRSSCLVCSSRASRSGRGLLLPW
jgi:hypothetical protein